MLQLSLALVLVATCFAFFMRPFQTRLFAWSLARLSTSVFKLAVAHHVAETRFVHATGSMLLKHVWLGEKPKCGMLQMRLTISALISTRPRPLTLK